MSAGMKTVMRGGISEKVGCMYRENWIGKQQREGRGSQEEIARVAAE